MRMTRHVNVMLLQDVPKPYFWFPATTQKNIADQQILAGEGGGGQDERRLTYSWEFVWL
jgi:hypothetical protein